MRWDDSCGPEFSAERIKLCFSSGCTPRTLPALSGGFSSSLRLILDPLDFTHWTCGRAMARSLLPCLLLLALAQTVSDSAHGTHGGVGLC